MQWHGRVSLVYDKRRGSGARGKATEADWSNQTLVEREEEGSGQVGQPGEVCEREGR